MAASSSLNAMRLWLDRNILTKIWYRGKYTTATNRLVQRFKAEPKLIKANRNERYQAITSDGRIFVCYHPDKKFPIEYTKSLQKLNDPWENMNDTMTKAQIQESLRLKADEPGIWGSKLLGRLFNIKPSAVREHVRLTKEQRKTLEQENKALKFFRPHKRRLYRRLLHLHRRKRLEEEAEKLKFTGQQ